jgi:hypothetical protein
LSDRLPKMDQELHRKISLRKSKMSRSIVYR